VLAYENMPLFDFSCRECGHQFEAFVRKQEPACPKCKSGDLERLMSLPAVRTEGTKQKTRAQSKKQELSIAAEKNHAQRQYELSHDD
jgi:putative FmdB family regulatory protein